MYLVSFVHASKFKPNLAGIVQTCVSTVLPDNSKTDAESLLVKMMQVDFEEMFPGPYHDYMSGTLLTIVFADKPAT